MTWPKSAKKIDIPIYCQEFYFFTNPDDWTKAVESIECPDHSFGARGIQEQFQNDQGEPLFMLGVFDGDPGTLVHECAHLAFDVLNLVGVPVEAGCPNEAYAYLIEFFYAQTIGLLK